MSSGDIEKILQELGKIKVPGFFAPAPQTKFTDSVSTSDALQYSILAEKHAFAESASTSEKILFKPRFADAPVGTTEELKVKSRSGETILLTDLLKHEGRHFDSSSLSDLLLPRIATPDSSTSSDLLKAITCILQDSVTTSDASLPRLNFADSSLSSDFLQLLQVKLPESLTTSDQALSAISLAQVFADSATTTDLLALVKAVLQEKLGPLKEPGGVDTSDTLHQKWKHPEPGSTVSDLLKYLEKNDESSSTSELLKYVLKHPESVSLIDALKIPIKHPESTGTSEALAFTYALGSDQETTTDAQSSYIITNKVTNSHFDTDLSSWTLNPGGGGTNPVRITSSPTPKYGAGAVYCNGGTSTGGKSWMRQQFTDVTASLVYVDGWVYITTYGITGSNGGQVVDVRNNATTTWCFSIHFASDGIYYANLGATSPWNPIPGVPPLGLNAWHHFRCLYDQPSALFKIYINGVQIFSNSGFTVNNVGTFSFGDTVTNSLSGRFRWDEMVIGTVVTQGSSLTSGVGPSMNWADENLVFDTADGYDSPGATSSGEEWIPRHFDV